MMERRWWESKFEGENIGRDAFGYRKETRV